MGFFVSATNSTNKTNKTDSTIEIVVNSRRRMHLCMQDDQNGLKMTVLTSAEETRLLGSVLYYYKIFFSEVINLV